MRRFSLSEIESLPETADVFCFLNETNKTVFVGVAKNLKQEIPRVLTEKDFLRKETRQIEIVNSTEKDLIKLYARTIRATKPFYNFDLSGQRHFPHFKITAEKFPRLLITRKIENDNAKYFGAFLPETGARLFLDFLIQTFLLRGCDIKIDGKFPVPCTQFYEKRCVAPCVESLCEKLNYDEIVKFIKLFLENKAEDLEKLLIAKIETAAENLDFETAGKLRDFLQDVQNVRNEKDFNYRLEDAVDSFETDETDEKVFVRLVSQCGRKILGKRVFVFEKIEGFEATEVLTQIIWQFYEFYAPKEIRVSVDFPNRKFLSEVLSLRSNRKFKINVVDENNQKITTERAFGRTKFEFDFRQIKPPKSLAEIQTELQREFNLNKKPHRIEAFDVAHLSGTDFVTAKSVWQNGKFLVSEYEFWLLPETSELETLEKGISERFKNKNNMPDLVLIDGGKSQL